MAADSSSEAGVCPEEESAAIRTGQLGPGEAISIDSHTGDVRFPSDVREHLSDRFDYRGWISTETLYVQDPFDNEPDERIDRAAYNAGSGAEALSNYFVGQIVGNMNESKPAARVVMEMVEEFIDATEALAKQLEV